MLTALHSVVVRAVALSYPLFAQESKGPAPKPPSENSIKMFFDNLDWWIWALVVALIVLIVVWVIVHKKGKED